MNYFVNTVNDDNLQSFLQKIAAKSGTDSVVSVCSDNELRWFKVVYKTNEKII